MFSPSFLSFFDRSGRKEGRVLKTHDRSLSQNKPIHIFGAFMNDPKKFHQKNLPLLLLQKKQKKTTLNNLNPSWWQLKYFFYFHPYFGEDEPILTHIFQRGWFNHQLTEVKKNWVTSPSFFSPQPPAPSEEPFLFFSSRLFGSKPGPGRCMLSNSGSLALKPKKTTEMPHGEQKKYGWHRFFWGWKKMLEMYTWLR